MESSEQKADGTAGQPFNSGLLGSKRQSESPEQEAGPVDKKQKVWFPECDGCTNPCQKFSGCDGGHIVCMSCIKAAILKVIETDEMVLACPTEDCPEVLLIDSLEHLEPSFSIDLFRSHIQKRHVLESEAAITKIEGVNRCPRCDYAAQFDDCVEVLTCPICKLSSCRHCLKSVTSTSDDVHLSGQDASRHSGCGLLRWRGTRCLEDVSLLPAHWDGFTRAEYTGNQGYIAVPLLIESQEYLEVAGFHGRTSRKMITEILRIQNPVCWQNYVLKRQLMLKELGQEELNERLLFHGTSDKSLKKICSEGFDCRKCNVNDAWYGQGSYFSDLASYSEPYARNRRSSSLLVSLVLLGRSTIGQPRFAFPPNEDRSGRMYDSCTDTATREYVLFCNSQAYPAYVVEYLT